MVIVEILSTLGSLKKARPGFGVQPGDQAFRGLRILPLETPEGTPGGAAKVSTPVRTLDAFSVGARGQAPAREG